MIAAYFRYELRDPDGERVDRATDLPVALRRAEDVADETQVATIWVHDDGVLVAKYSRRDNSWKHFERAA